MENASKALIMAASMLMGIMILTLAVYLFTTFGAQAAQVKKQNETQQLREFNEQFLRFQDQSNMYEEKKKNQTPNDTANHQVQAPNIRDVITVANIAQNNNKYYNLTQYKNGIDNYISVKISTNDDEKNASIENYTTTQKNDLLAKNINNFFTCKVTISEITGRVCKVTFNIIKDE